MWRGGFRCDDWGSDFCDGCGGEVFCCDDWGTDFCDGCGGEVFVVMLGARISVMGVAGRFSL